MNEVPIVQARANVMYYDDGQKKWIPMGMSKVQIYRHQTNNTFRVVGRTLQEHEVVINSAILKNLKYNQARPSFHQWRDLKQVYGLNFANNDEAENFATAMLAALETLNNQGYKQPGPPEPPSTHPPTVPHGYQQQQQQQPIPHQQHQLPAQVTPRQNGAVAEPQEPRPLHQTHRRVPSGSGPSIPVAPVAPPAPAVSSAPPAAPPAPSIPPAAPPAPPVPVAPPPPSGAPAAPPAPPVPAGGGPPAPAPPAVGGPPAPPPPPPTGGAVGGGKGMSLADQLQAAKLKKREPEQNSAEPVSKPPISSGGGTHLDELQKALKRRMGKEEKDTSETSRTESPSPANQPAVTNTPTKPWERPQTNGNRIANGQDSPKPPRKVLVNSEVVDRRMPSLTGQENFQSSAAGGASHSDLENLKQEILTEMRKEINAMKNEILAAIRDSAR